MDTVCWRCGAVYNETRHPDRCPRCLVPEPRSSSGSVPADAPTPASTPVPPLAPTPAPAPARGESAGGLDASGLDAMEVRTPEPDGAETPELMLPAEPPPPPALPAEPPPPGAAWERREQLGFFRGLAATALDFLFRPRRSALEMRSGEGLGDPLLFVLLVVTFAVAVVLSSAGVAIALGLRTVLAASASETVSRFFSLTWGSIFLSIALTPPLVLVWIFAVALALHVIGMVVGLDRRGFEATFRAVAYATGATSLVATIPFVGAPGSVVWWLCSTGGALAGAHRAPGGRAAATVLLPFLGVLVAGGALFFFLLALAGAAIGGAGGGGGGG